VESAVKKQQGIMGNKVKKEKPGMPVKFLMSSEEFGFHLGLNTECILTRFKT
jgi:hypothetical protein